MLVIVVMTFALLWLPYRLFVVYNSFANKKFHNLWFRLICRIMVYMNSAINPILYNVMSVKFHGAFRRLLFCEKQERHMQQSQQFATYHAVSKRGQQTASGAAKQRSSRTPPPYNETAQSPLTKEQMR